MPNTTDIYNQMDKEGAALVQADQLNAQSNITPAPESAPSTGGNGLLTKFTNTGLMTKFGKQPDENGFAVKNVGEPIKKESL